MDVDDVTMRAPTPADVAGFAVLVAESFDTYRSFAPAGWDPPPPTRSLAHFWQLFVAREWWGSGLAARLHAAVVEAAAHRGFTAMRLFTPAAQARARRFYEREGWRLWAAPVDDEIGFPVVEYRLDLA